MRILRPEEYTARYHDPAAEREGFSLHEAEAADYRLPRRSPVGHKYSFGRALIVAGARGYSGAPALAANACERAGAGLTWLMVPESIYPIAAARCDGAVVTPLPAAENGGIGAAAIPAITAALKKAKACLIGPGLGTGEEQKQLVRAVLREAACPLVLDADALTAVAGEEERLDACRAPLLLTPHTGEFRRISGQLDAGRLAGALAFTAEHPQAVLLLKGYGTLICRGREVSVNPTGGPALAKGGTGDVLGGILCALLAQGLEPTFAAGCAAYLHGLAGDLAAAELSEYSLAPSDLIRFLPRAMRTLEIEA